MGICRHPGDLNLAGRPSAIPQSHGRTCPQPLYLSEPKGHHASSIQPCAQTSITLRERGNCVVKVSCVLHQNGGIVIR